LRAATGEPVADLLTQTKPLALLAYLVIAEPRGHHRRDRLLGLFWPEVDEPHARGALRKTLHALRRGLGDSVLDARGDEDVGIAAGALACDVLAFDEAIEGGQTARALELYRGDLLPGFYVREATEFQQWLDLTRASYLKQAATAAWIMAERSELEERATIAGEWARRAATLSPFDERVVRKALALLGRVGDRA
jgi:serine/threonine-protein kinase